MQSLINSIYIYRYDDHEVYLFGKIMKNQCDEEFRLVQCFVKDTILDLLKFLIREKYPFKSEGDSMIMIENI